ncbi:MAG: HAD-IIB family hydrolase [Chloroflexi bacterium]|nr:HAD-IIB family hydrolase [Chloroflexota bacterium]MCI0775760.1 HAD-IIB family hydrolase [Chloroflexota bacterium]MCI0834025.1 HAD-IIB family hydrolase [Chloroflexota bacterium]MCI0837290.1 HAD-IIB family hydrolase [Chloroflexota bacterium]MCI0881475.1 HAD-IIB family hydrolase [Chloroflexota bacterium]
MKLPDFATETPLAVALDLDETTLGSNSRLTGRTRRALHSVRAAGLPIIIATSRPERVLSVLVGDDILQITSLVQMNGTIATGRAGLTGSFRWPIDHADARLCWTIANEMNPQARMTMEIDGIRFAVNHDDEVNSLWAFGNASPTMVVAIEEAMRIGPAKVSINGLDNNLGELAEALENRLSENTIVFRAAKAQFLNIVPRRATKSGAVAALLNVANIALDDVLAFGDDYVDIDLMRDCGWSVAVDNAVPEVKSLARYGTASNDDHGVAMVLERLVAAL